MTKYILSIVLSSFAAGLVACSGSSSLDDLAPATVPKAQPTEGTQDGGGGLIAGSTSEEVREAVKDSLEIILKADNLFVQMSLADVPGFTKEEIEEGKHVLQVIHRPAFIRFDWLKKDPRAKDLFKDDSRFDEDLRMEEQLKREYHTDKRNLSDYLSMSRIVFLEEGSCPAPDKDNADASVSKQAFGADVCFSLSNLRRIPSASLRQHIAGLWMHEITHLNGFGERMAQLMEQKMVLIFRQLAYASAAEMPERLSSLMRSAKYAAKDVYSALRFAPNVDPVVIDPHIPWEPDYSRAFYSIGQTSAYLASCLQIFDETGSLKKVFMGKEVEAQRQQIVTDLRMARDVLYRYNSHKESEIGTNQFRMDLEEIQKLIERASETMEKIQLIYEEQAHVDLGGVA